MNPAAFALRWLSAGAAGLVLACSAHASNTNTEITLAQIAARSVEAKYGRTGQEWRLSGAPRTVTASGTLGEVVATSRMKGPSPLVGEVIDIDIKRKLPWASISKAVAKSLPLISTAVAIADIAQLIRCRESAGGGAECDEGQNETQQTVTLWRYQYGNDPPKTSLYEYASATEACNAMAAWKQQNSPGQTWTRSSNTSSICGITCTNVNGFCGSQTGGLGSQTTTQMACPAVVVNGVTLYPVKGPDGKCMTNVYEPASEQEVADKVEEYGDKSKAVPVANELLNAGRPIDHPDMPQADPVPSSVQGPRETTTNPDGSTTVRDTRYDLAPTAKGYEWVPAVTVKDYPPGAVIPPPGEVSGGTTTTGSAPKEDPITCGLPNTPPCRIDESGTPSTADIPTAEVDQAKGEALTKITDIGTIQAPAWSWSFSLPTACQAITVGPFLSQTVVVDLCEYQSMIHDLVALLWAGFTVWAIIGMVGRTFATG